MGLPLVTSDRVSEWQDRLKVEPHVPVSVDLVERTIMLGDDAYPIEMQETARRSLISGTWDSTAALLIGEEEIASAQSRIPYLQWRRKS